MTELGFYGGGREGLKKASDRAFLILTNSLEECLSLEKFVEHVRLRYGVDTRPAVACFHAADLDDSGLLNRHEFLLANEVMMQCSLWVLVDNIPISNIAGQSLKTAHP